MTRKFRAAFASLAAAVSALAFARPPCAAAAHDGQRHQRGRQHAAERTRQRAPKARKMARRRAVGYVCPMHPDVRSKARGECPKCGMELVAERRAAATSSGSYAELRQADDAADAASQGAADAARLAEAHG